MRLAYLAFVAAVLPACNLYHHSHEGDDVCVEAGNGEGESLPVALRNPNTGACEGFGGGYPDGCECGPCPYADVAEEAPAIPSWGFCSSSCDGLDEATCRTTSGCQTAYYEEGTALVPEFLGCWATAQNGPISTGTCAGLDAEACQRHDNCAMIYTGDPRADQAFNEFERCASEEAAPACETLTTEDACAGRSDCTPTYVGTDCTCTPGGCTCEHETYDHCASGAPAL